jgi:hypothetical protein
MDRICFGVGSIFLVKYPLQKLRKQQVMEQILSADPEMEPEEVETQVEQHFRENGFCRDSSLTCESYPEDQIKVDDEATLDCFEYALNEVQQASAELEQSALVQAQQQFENEKNQIESQFKESFSNMKQAEEQKVHQLKMEHEELEKSLIEQQQRMQLMQIMTEEKQQ